VDVLVTDVIMPRMGGPELARRLQRLDPNLRVLFISGYTENAVIHTGRVQPGMHHLPKPFTPDALARKVAEVMAPRTMTAR
jgi:CheY-like chemotaxis protein